VIPQLDSGTVAEISVKVLGLVALIRQMMLSVSEVWALVGKSKKPKNPAK